MPELKTADELALCIEGADPQIVDRLKALDDRCLLTSDGRTLFDVAIASSNTAVMELLATDRMALAYAAPTDESLKHPIKHILAEQGIEFPLFKLEERLERSFGNRESKIGAGLSYGRTPLLTACRLGNEKTTALLLNAGAKTTDRDLLGLTAPELCLFSHGEEGLAGFLRAFEASGQKKFTVTRGLLEEVLAHPELLERLLATGKLALPAQKLLFCYHCARLDRDAVRQMLGQGFDLNKAVSTSLNPLEQACTSELFWKRNLPESKIYAYHLIKYRGPAGSHSISVDNDLINEDGSNFGKLMAGAERQRQALIAEAKALTMDPQDEADLIDRRCAMVDTLVEGGLNLNTAQNKLDWDFIDDLENMEMDTLLAHLARHGVSNGLGNTKNEGALSEVTWELSGETSLSATLLPLANTSGLARLTLSNPYGPIDDIVVEVRPLTDDDNPEDDWFELLCQRETLDIDGDIVDRDTLDEPVYGEAPWQAIYEAPLPKADKASNLQIRLWCENDDALNDVLLDWEFIKA